MTLVSSPSHVPLRSNEERLAFCDAYFRAVQAKVVCAAANYREYELPRDVDKELTDRPYYWMWVEKTNQAVKPTILRLAFTEEALQRENQRLKQEALAEREQMGMSGFEKMFFRPPSAEFVTLGSFRLNKLYESLDRRGRFACVRPFGSAPNTLVPWLMMNAKVSYRCDLVEQEYVSVGCCLVNGQIVERFFDMINKIQMEPANPDDLLARAVVTPVQAAQRIRTHLERRSLARPQDWARDAFSRLERELKQIRTYYQSILPDARPEERPLVEAEQARKERELSERAQPRIEIESRQLAVVGLVERG